MKRLFLAAMLLPACGGGGGSSSTFESAALEGLIYEVDGQTVDRSGIEVTLLETGETVTTDILGDFKFRGLLPGDYSLGFNNVLPLLEEGEDMPVIAVTDECGTYSLRIALRNGRIEDFELDSHEGQEARGELEREADFVEGDVSLREGGRFGDRFAVTVYGCEPGEVILIFVGGDDVGVAEANGDGVARFVREGDNLPLRLPPRELEGMLVEVFKTIEGARERILVGEIPDLPEHHCKDRDDEEEPDGEPDGDGDDDGEHTGSHVGRNLLGTEVDGIEASVEIRSWPEQELQRFRMAIAGLEPGDHVAFEIEDPETDGWIVIARRTVNDDGVAKADTNHDLAMPLGVESTSELQGLRVRIRRDEDDNDEVLAGGRVPELVRD